VSDHPTALDRAEAVNEALGLTELTSSEVPPEVQTWLARLALLYGVPFEHLVPDATMLPAESIRFFHLDANWVESMVDGAFSVGVHSQRDVRFHRLLQPAVREATAIAAGKLRRQLRGAPDASGAAEAVDTPDARRAGFLMRSEIVSGWPGLEIAGYAGPDPDTSDRVPIVRLDRLAPDLLMCLFADVPELVVVNEPREGLHFGVGSQELEGLDWDGPDDHGRIAVGDLAGKLADAGLGTLAGRDLGPGDFAALMIDSAAEHYFVSGQGG
jgi:hypothetical protein